MNFYDIASLLAIFFLLIGSVRDVYIVYKHKKKQSHYLRKLEATKNNFLKTRDEFSEIASYVAPPLQNHILLSERQEDYLIMLNAIVLKNDSVTSQKTAIKPFPGKYKNHPAIGVWFINELLEKSFTEYKKFAATSQTRIDQFSSDGN